MISMFQASVIKSKRNTKRHHNSCRVKKRKKNTDVHYATRPKRRSFFHSSPTYFIAVYHRAPFQWLNAWNSLTYVMLRLRLALLATINHNQLFTNFIKKKNEKNFFNQCFPRPFFPGFHFNPLLLILRAGMMTQILCFDLIPTQHCDLVFLWCQCWRSFQIFGLGKLETQRKI